jgi:putative sigma-54 modulation protein
MQTSVTFKNFESSEALKSYVQTKLDKLDKFLDAPVEANVVLSVEKIRHISEIHLIGDRLNIQATESSDSMYSSIDMVLDKLRHQIKKNKQKHRERRPISKNGIKGAVSDEISTIQSEPEDIVIETIDYKPMDIDEAVMQMKLDTDNFFVFTNSRTQNVNVLYKKKDGNFGLIQPNS